MTSYRMVISQSCVMQKFLRERVEMLGQVEPYVGNFFSKVWVRKHILNQTQEEIDEIEKRN